MRERNCCTMKIMIIMISTKGTSNTHSRTRQTPRAFDSGCWRCGLLGWLVCPLAGSVMGSQAVYSFPYLLGGCCAEWAYNKLPTTQIHSGRVYYCLMHKCTWIQQHRQIIKAHIVFRIGWCVRVCREGRWWTPNSLGIFLPNTALNNCGVWEDTSKKYGYHVQNWFLILSNDCPLSPTN